MYFRNYRLQKTWLDNCLKSLVLEDLFTSNLGNWPKDFEIWTRAPLTCLLITVKAIELEKVSVIDMQNLTTVS